MTHGSEDGFGATYDAEGNILAPGIPAWYSFLREARALRVSPFELDPRAQRSRYHPAWRYWAGTAEAVEPPEIVRIAGLSN